MMNLPTATTKIKLKRTEICIFASPLKMSCREKGRSYFIYENRLLYRLFRFFWVTSAESPDMPYYMCKAGPVDWTPTMIQSRISYKKIEDLNKLLATSNVLS